MARYFFDSSALVKYYHRETGTDRVTSIFGEPGRIIRISRVGLVEIQSAFAMKVRAGIMGRTVATAQSDLSLSDISRGWIEVFGHTEEHFAVAETLIKRYGYSSRLRTLDAVQLAVALDLAAANLVDSFVVADKVLAEIAIKESLHVINPDL